MLHFPSKLQTSINGSPRRPDSHSLNATQQKSASHPIFLKVEEELHDARRVHADGQEDDLRYALNMVISRVTELSSLLGEAYKTQADLEVQLNVAKSNLKMVIANNEMLEDALKTSSSSSKDVGWRRTSMRDISELRSSDAGGHRSDPRGSIERSHTIDYAGTPVDASPPPSAGTPTSSGSNTMPQQQQQQDNNNRFFKFRFSSGSASTSTSRPGTPAGGISSGLLQQQHLTSPSMPSLSSAGFKNRDKEVEELTAELEKERAARKKAADEKAALEEELESLSQALFEEANNMVATERKLRAEAEEELNELKTEKEALKSALKVIEGENTHLRTSSVVSSPQPEALVPSQSHRQSYHGESQTASIATSQPQRHSYHSQTHSSSHHNSPTPSRSSSRVGVKSRGPSPSPSNRSIDFTSAFPLPPSPSPSYNHMDDDDDDEDFGEGDRFMGNGFGNGGARKESPLPPIPISSPITPQAPKAPNHSSSRPTSLHALSDVITTQSSPSTHPTTHTTTHPHPRPPPSSLLSPILSPEEESQPTPRFRINVPPQSASAIADMFAEPSPWADVPSAGAGGF